MEERQPLLSNRSSKLKQYAPFELVPPEILLEIFYHLNFAQLCVVASVKKSWKQIAYNDFLWKRQYLISFQRNQQKHEDAFENDYDEPSFYNDLKVAQGLLSRLGINSDAQMSRGSSISKKKTWKDKFEIKYVTERASVSRISPRPPRGVVLRSRSRTAVVTGALFIVTSMATLSLFGWFVHSNNELWVAVLFAAVVQVACFCILFKQVLFENIDAWVSNHGELPSPFKDIYEGRKFPCLSEQTIPNLEYNLLHMAVLLEDEELTREIGKQNLINKLATEPDAFGFTPLHYSYISNSNFSTLLRKLVSQDIEVPNDFFLGSPQDYHKIFNPNSNKDLNRKCIKIFSHETQQIIFISIAELELTFRITYSLSVQFSTEFLHQIFTNAYAICKNEENALKYGSQIESLINEENLILAKIGDRVGYGVFAAKDFEIGEFITVYGSELVLLERTFDLTYCAKSAFPQFVHDGRIKRSLGGFVNHSSNPNAKLLGIIQNGKETLFLSAIRKIPKGNQICFSYNDDAVPEQEFNEMLTGKNEFPEVLPVSL